MNRVLVQLDDRSYAIQIGAAALAQLPPCLPADKGQIVAVTDANVWRLHEARIQSALPADTEPIVIPAGEASKSLAQAGAIYEQLADRKVGRDAVVVVIGGGVVGDLAGFVAATWMRGIRFIQVPTTLEAAIDAAVGGKTAINLPQGKNLVGAFHQPIAVIVDTDFFATLPPRDFRAGLAESVKHGAIRDAAFFAWHEQNAAALADGGNSLLEELVARNCAIKAAVVAADEREANLREILNYGHTIGHAIEKNAEYELRHGECVSLGMVAENQLAVARGLLASDAAARVESLLTILGLPTRLTIDISSDKLFASCKLDKKNKSGNIRFALIDAIGSTVRCDDASNDEILAAIRYLSD